MKSPFLTVFIVVLALLGSVVAASAAATIEFEKTTIDIGQLYSGQKSKLVFSFKNTGDEPLEMGKVTVSCGCTDAKAAADVVKPGESSAIEATFDSTGFSGESTKRMVVHSNDPAHPKIMLTFIANILPIAKLTPENLNFGDLKVGGSIATDVVVASLTPKPFKILKVESPNKRITAECKESPKTKGTYNLKIVVKAGDKPGRVMEQVKIVTDLPGCPIVAFAIYGNVVEEVPASEKPS